jgi:hypothetical protein
VTALLIVVGVWSPVGAHDDGTTSHLWGHFLSMREPGTINTSYNPVHWTKLQGVPASLADGLDNIGSAGFGLGVTRPSTFYVNTSQIQRRVSTACGQGQAIKSIAADGTVTCTTGPIGMSKRIADTGQICNGFCTEGTLTLSPGTWAITGKIIVRQTDGSESWLAAVCELHAGGLIDRAEAEQQVDNITEIFTLNMQLLATLTSNLNASIQCEDLDVGSAFGSDLSIMAIRLNQ